MSADNNRASGDEDVQIRELREKIDAAMHSMGEEQQSQAEPEEAPTQPWWVRYWLPLALCLIAAKFVVRNG
jgi:hypothetical protein